MKTILLETKGPVAWVWLNQPRRLNAIDQTTLIELRQAFEALKEDEAVIAIVLAGRGQAFSSGFDVAWMAGLEAERVARELAGIRAVYDAIEACAKPLIATVHGPALGGGLLLALVADLRLASERASFGVPEVKIGIFPSLGLVPRLERLVGLGAAKHMVLTGEAIDAAEAQRLGLVDRILVAEELQAEAQALAEYLAALPPTALRLSKAAFDAAQRQDYTEWETAQFAACWASPERKAAMNAFLKTRRVPDSESRER
ncbi:MAG: enoyl-CoA hydratase/isomerase family protein [Anaerolineae bacterium]